MSPVAQYVVQATVTLLGIALLALLVVTANRRLGAAVGRGPLELLGRLPLEGRRTVYMVRVNNRVLVLAATDHQITKVADLPDEGEVTPAATQRSQFTDVMGRLFQRTPNPSAQTSPTAASAAESECAGSDTASSDTRARRPENDE